jgi:hypothetical protein
MNILMFAAEVPPNRINVPMIDRTHPTPAHVQKPINLNAIDPRLNKRQ